MGAPEKARRRDAPIWSPSMCQFPEDWKQTDKLCLELYKELANWNLSVKRSKAEILIHLKSVMVEQRLDVEMSRKD